MNLRALAPALLVVLGLASMACTPDPSTSASAASGPNETPTVTPLVDPAIEATQLISQAFSASGEAAHVQSVVFEDGLLRVTLGLQITTIGDADVYQRICVRLASLIATPEDPGEVLGVQTFGPNGAAVVATGDPQLRCAKFYR